MHQRDVGGTTRREGFLKIERNPFNASIFDASTLKQAGLLSSSLPEFSVFHIPVSIPPTSLKSNPTTVHNTHIYIPIHCRTYVPASLLSTFCILSFPLPYLSHTLSFFFFLHSSCPPFTHARLLPRPGLTTTFLPTTRAFPALTSLDSPQSGSRKVGRGPLVIDSWKTFSVISPPTPLFSFYVSLLCNEPAKICLEIPYTWRDPSLHEVSDGESCATFHHFFCSSPLLEC